MLIGFVCAFGAAFGGLVVGVTSAYFGGRVDMFVQRVVDIFIAFPGIILALLFVGYVVIAAVRSPDVAPPFSEDLVPLTKEELRSELIGGLGILALIMLVIGGIWAGFFTPTEAAGFGALGALVIGVIKGMRMKEVVEMPM